MEYINPDSPRVQMPEYPGHYYESWVPATLDIAERARLCINALTETTDPEYDNELYWIVDLLANEPAMYHSIDDHVQFKFMQALPLDRIASGSRQNMEIERRLLTNFLKMQGPDGLVYIPIKGRPWALPQEKEAFAGLDFLPEGDHWCSICMNGRILGAFCVYAMMDPSGPWREVSMRLARGLMDLFIVEGETAYLFRNCTVPGLAVTKPRSRPEGIRVAMAGWVAEGLAKCARFLGYNEAGEMAGRLMRYIMRDSGYFLHGGEFGPESEDLELAHFHAHTTQILATLEVVQATGDEELLGIAKNAYDYAVRCGEPIVGFFPEWIGHRGGSTSEICGVADMIACGLKLCRLGFDEWDDVDRWIRNQFAECQLTSTRWLTDGHLDGIDRDDVRLPAAGCGGAEYGTTDQVLKRVLGSFAGWPSPSDFIKGNGWSIMHCCTGNAARTLYYIWESIVDWHDGKLRVNLLLNRASRWADVNSHIPYRGQVDVMVKEDLSLEVRIPDWVSLHEVVCTVDGTGIPVEFEGRYAAVDQVKRGDKVSIEFPVSDRTDRVCIWGQDYVFVRRGNDVVWVDPPGSNCPLYQRGHFRQAETLWRPLTRFIHEEDVDWC